MSAVDVLAVINRLIAPTARESVSCEEAGKVYDAVAELMDAAQACTTANVLRGSPKRARILAALARCKGER